MLLCYKLMSLGSQLWWPSAEIRLSSKIGFRHFLHKRSKKLEKPEDKNKLINSKEPPKKSPKETPAKTVWQCIYYSEVAVGCSTRAAGIFFPQSGSRWDLINQLTGGWSNIWDILATWWLPLGLLMNSGYATLSILGIIIIHGLGIRQQWFFWSGCPTTCIYIYII